MDILKQALVEIGIPNLFQKFVDEKIDPHMIEELTDMELKRLGIDTIGDRYRLKECLKLKLSQKDINNNTQNNSIAEEIERERNLVFGNFVSRKSGKRSKLAEKRKKNSRGWTVKFVCLANKASKKVPTASEKEILSRAGLGIKKIKLEHNDTEVDVMEKIMSDEIMQESEMLGFPQLKDCGGFELLRTEQNCRQLDVINCRDWSVKELKANIGCQSTVYIRPIQKNLSTKPIENKTESVLMTVKCKGCGNPFTVRELRMHTALCESAFLMASDSDSDGSLPPLPFAQNENVLVTPSYSSTSGSEIQLFDEQGNPLRSVPVLNQSSESFVNLSTPEPILTSPEISLIVEDPHFQGNNNLENELFGQGTSIAGNYLTEQDANTSENKTIEQIVEEVIMFCKMNNVTDPVEILRKCQKDICIGRALDIEDTTTCDEGETNFILVNREKVLETGLDEVKDIADPRKTLEVQFYDEVAADYGGPRKEFFRLFMMEVKEKYFDNGLRELLAPDYETIGKIFALSVLQNGKIPTFIANDHLIELFDAESPSLCIANLRKGMNSLGLCKIASELPAFKFLFHPTNGQMLTFKKLTTLLKPQFGEEGSNKRQFEQDMYSVYFKYLREVASGRRPKATLGSILQFVTGLDEEPILGYRIQPSIVFSDAESYLPTASTCINRITLTRPSVYMKIPEEEIIIFHVFDLAFLNTLNRPQTNMTMEHKPISGELSL